VGVDHLVERILFVFTLDPVNQLEIAGHDLLDQRGQQLVLVLKW
jgi:hypothetical protein